MTDETKAGAERPAVRIAQELRDGDLLLAVHILDHEGDDAIFIRSRGDWGRRWASLLERLTTAADRNAAEAKVGYEASDRANSAAAAEHLAGAIALLAHLVPDALDDPVAPALPPNEEAPDHA